MSDEQLLGRYRLIELLGQGGFAAVYRAENTSLGIEVALKIMDQSLARDEQFVTRFRQEARETARLDHPNIVRVLDLNQVDEQLFMAMEYVPGQDLNRWIVEKGPLLSMDQVVSIATQIAAALDYAHQQGLVHRDIKPHNILIRPDGVVKLVDFGIVKAAEGTRLTKTGTLIGTPTYMSPEQIRGVEVGPGSDIYSLGIVTYELITGRIPFDGDTATLGYKHVHEPPPRPSSITPRAGGPIEVVLLRVLEKTPAERYPTAGAFAAALGQAVDQWQAQAVQEQFRQAQQYISARNYVAALPVLEALQSLAPDDPDVANLLAQANAGLKLEQLYQEAGDHLQNARDIADNIQAEDPEFPDHQFVFQTLQGAPAPSTAATVVDGLPPGRSEVEALAAPAPGKKMLSIITALRWSGLILAIFAYNGFWQIDSLQTWGITALSVEAVYPHILLAPIVAFVYIGLLILQHFVPRLTLLWRLLRMLLVFAGGAVLLLAFITDVFDNRSTGPIMAAIGLFLAGLSDMLALLFLRPQE